MIGLRSRALALMGTAALTAAMVGVTPATAAPRALGAQGTPFGQARFAAYGTGSELSVKGVTSGASTLASVEQAFSGNTVSSGGLGGPITSGVTGALVQSDQTANKANAYARGSGLEVGLGLTAAQANQIQQGLAEAHAPPPSGLISATAIPINLPGLVQTGLLHGKAAAAYNNTFCPIGQPIAYGEGAASAPTSVVGTPPLISGTGASGTQAAQSRTRTDLVANPDGTFGIRNTVQEIIAPLTVNLGVAQLLVTVTGDGPDSPLTVSTFNTGQGSSGVTFLNNNPVVKIDLVIGGVTTPVANVQASLLQGVINPLLGTGGLVNLLLAPLGINLSVDVARTSALPGAVAGATSVLYDLLAINASLPAAGLTIADLRVGHVESEVVLPNGPIACTVPVAKNANPAVVQAGSSFTWNISVPSSAAALNDSACDLTHIMVTDVIGIDSGSPTFTVGAISNGGVYNPATKTVTWANIGNYHPGDPPIVLTVNVSVPSGSAAGVLKDTASVAAGLGNCNGGATGLASAIGNVSNVVLGGSITLIAPRVNANGGNPGLAATGTGPLLPWLAAGLLIMAEATRRLLRRSHRPPQLG